MPLCFQTGGYYDISFQQAPTSLATGRDANLANVPYSMSDGRFARTDNASPVPSSLSQQVKVCLTFPLCFDIFYFNAIPLYNIVFVIYFSECNSSTPATYDECCRIPTRLCICVLWWISASC